MNFIYIGQYTEGTTSKMRADQLMKILTPTTIQVIDTHIPFYQTSRLWRSFGFRYKKGLLITKINDYIINNLKEGYDLIWIDKAIFLTKKTTTLLRTKTKKLVHFTPDMAFYENKSNHFNKSISLYDCVITTKTAELALYKKYTDNKVITTTQGFDKNTHYSNHRIEEKINAIAFIGLYEKSREDIISTLLNNKITIKLVGKGWNKFVSKNKTNSNLEYLGDAIYSREYANLISSCYFSLGLLSKKIPEFHTTRTFEIPACKTILITERNKETTAFFKNNEVIFYSTPEELIEKIRFYQKNIDKLKQLTERGNIRVHKDNYDYEELLQQVLKKIT